MSIPEVLAGSRSWHVETGDALAVLRSMLDASVQCCVTSPPYFGLRNYQADGQIGLERTLQEYVARLVEVFAEVRRVLREDGTLWLNIGDCYNAYPDNRGTESEYAGKRKEMEARFPEGYGLMAPSLKPKDLCGIPWRVAFALQADGWWLRSDIIWEKSNPMPESVRDRPTKAHEYIFLLTKRDRYFWDSDAVREPHHSQSIARRNRARSGGKYRGTNGAQPKGNPHSITLALDHCLHPAGRNMLTVWRMATQPFPGDHFAVFPFELAERCIKAGTSEMGCCSRCGAPRMRRVEREPMVIRRSGRTHEKGRTRSSGTVVDPPRATTVGWSASCDCGAAGVGCVVLDPFCGAGTAGVVATHLVRRFVGIELNPEYAEMGRDRIRRGYYAPHPTDTETPLFDGAGAC